MKKGFTLIELLVVIAIIGILSAIGLVSLNGAREKARDAQAKSDLGQMRTALTLYYDDHTNEYPGQTAALADDCAGADFSTSESGVADTGVWAAAGSIVGTNAYLGNSLNPPTTASRYYYCANDVVANGAAEYVLFYKLENGGDQYYYSVDTAGTVIDFSASDTTIPSCGIAAGDPCAG